MNLSLIDSSLAKCTFFHPYLCEGWCYFFFLFSILEGRENKFVYFLAFVGFRVFFQYVMCIFIGISFRFIDLQSTCSMTRVPIYYILQLCHNWNIRATKSEKTYVKVKNENFQLSQKQVGKSKLFIFGFTRSLHPEEHFMWLWMSEYLPSASKKDYSER